MAPLLSVIMPTYNGAKFVGAALESLRREGAEDIEILVLDDGSSDQTCNVVRGFSAVCPIRLMTPCRVGNWVSLSNMGLHAAEGEWACFLHQDDLWLPGKMALIRREAACAKGALALHNAMFIGPDGDHVGPWTCPLIAGDIPSSDFTERLLIQNFIAIPSPIFRRKVAIETGGVDEKLWFAADWDLWLRLGAMGPVRFAAETLTGFRIHPASQTTSRNVTEDEWRAQLTDVFNRHRGNWHSTNKVCHSVEQAARVSIEVNCALAATSREQSVKIGSLLRHFIALKPSAWRRYLRDSRIVQRVRARLKVQGLRRAISASSASVVLES